MKEEKVKWFSKKKYNCKRNKGEHEYNIEIKYEPEVRYIYKHKNGQLHTHTPIKEEGYKYIKTELKVAYTCTCKHCGHKDMVFLSNKVHE